MKILVCDDDQQYVDMIINYLDVYKDECITHDIKGISSSRELLTEIKINKYDVAYLDIEIGDVNGIDIAAALVEKNPNCIIVFVTSYYQYIHKAFLARACNYIHKPFEESEFEAVYYQVLETYKRSQAVYVFNTSKGKQTFSPYNILYVETYYNSLKIVTTKESYYSNIKNAKYIKTCLKPYNFMQIHQSVFVNFHHVDRIKNDYVILRNGQEFPISLNRKQEIIEAYNRFIVRR